MRSGYKSSSRTKRKPGPKPKTTPAERKARALSLTGVRSVGRTRLIPLGDAPRLAGLKKLNAENPPGMILTIKEREELKKSILALMEVNNIAYTVAAKAVGISAATACLWRKADLDFFEATEAAHVATVGALVDAAQNLYARVLGDEEADTKDRLGVADKVLRSRAAAEHLLAPAAVETKHVGGGITVNIVDFTGDLGASGDANKLAKPVAAALVPAEVVELSK